MWQPISMQLTSDWMIFPHSLINPILLHIDVMKLRISKPPQDSSKIPQPLRRLFKRGTNKQRLHVEPVQ
jgi:hypothetical protein